MDLKIQQIRYTDILQYIHVYNVAGNLRNPKETYGNVKIPMETINRVQ